MVSSRLPTGGKTVMLALPSLRPRRVARRSTCPSSSRAQRANVYSIRESTRLRLLLDPVVRGFALQTLQLRPGNRDLSTTCPARIVGLRGLLTHWIRSKPGAAFYNS